MTSIKLKETVREHNPDARRARHNLIAIRSQIARHARATAFALTATQGTAPDEPSTGHVGNSATLTVLARFQLAEQLILASPLVPEIEALDALYAEIEAAEAREQAEADAIADATNAARDAENAARERLLAKLDADPALKAAREKLAGLQPAPEPADPAIAKAHQRAAATPRLGRPLGELADPNDVLAV